MKNNIIQEGFIFLMKKHGLEMKDLKYIGYSDCSYAVDIKGAMLLQYNIVKYGHEFFKSTVSFKFGW